MPKTPSPFGEDAPDLPEGSSVSDELTRLCQLAEENDDEKAAGDQLFELLQEAASSNEKQPEQTNPLPRPRASSKDNLGRSVNSQSSNSSATNRMGSPGLKAKKSPGSPGLKGTKSDTLKARKPSSPSQPPPNSDYSDIKNGRHDKSPARKESKEQRTDDAPRAKKDKQGKHHEGGEKTKGKGKKKGKSDSAAEQGVPFNPKKSVINETDQWWVYYDQPQDAAHMTQESFEDSMNLLGTFNNMFQFWERFGDMGFENLPISASLRTFKRGVTPSWEHPANHNGGKWIVVVPKLMSVGVFNEVLAAVISGQVGYVNGVLLAKKRREDLVNVWTAAAPERALEAIKKAIVHALEKNLSIQADISFKKHGSKKAQKTAKGAGCEPLNYEDADSEGDGGEEATGNEPREPRDLDAVHAKDPVSKETDSKQDVSVLFYAVIAIAMVAMAVLAGWLTSQQ